MPLLRWLYCKSGPTLSDLDGILNRLGYTMSNYESPSEGLNHVSIERKMVVSEVKKAKDYTENRFHPFSLAAAAGAKEVDRLNEDLLQRLSGRETALTLQKEIDDLKEKILVRKLQLERYRLQEELARLR